MAKKAKQEPGGDFVGGVNLTEVEHLLAFMQAHGLEDFEYQQGDIHIRLKKSVSSPAGAVAPAAAPSYAPPADVPVPVGEEVPASVAHSHAVTPQQTEDLHLVKSPIVGTFYAASGPDADPYVTPGSRVETGQVLCIIEAMKLMNEIEADVAGEVARIFVENGHPVEYGEPLFGIRTSGKKS